MATDLSPPTSMRPWLRRTIIVALLAAAGTIAVYAYNQAAVGQDATSATKPASVKRFIPSPGSEVLAQSEVGIDLQIGYDADLEINGVRISRVAAGPEDDGLRKTLSIGRITYQPGPGRTITALQPERNCVTAWVWSQQEGRGSASPVRWCFSAS
jgi:hypothetical protein